jgi:hypothetical protein
VGWGCYIRIFALDNAGIKNLNTVIVVIVWVCVCVGFVMYGCFGHMCNCIYCVSVFLCTFILNCY